MYPIGKIGGVISAVLFYRDEKRRADWEAFERNLAVLKAAGVDGVCVNGATGEYACATPAERREAVARAKRVMGGEIALISGAGATSLDETVQHARAAEAEGADAHLIPVPHFFAYSQADVGEFYRRAAMALEKPVLIYNLPQFAGRVDLPLAIELIRDESNRISGIKDSSGSLDILAELTAGGPAGAVRLVGNDSVLAEALERRICQGMISGVAGVLPELNRCVFDAWQVGDRSRFESAGRLLAQFIERIDAWPVPWGLKLAAEVRGLGKASFALPLTSERLRQAEEFRRWFEPWWAAAVEAMAPLGREA
jgi:4-hydroxy-tetrahydrodipicolinate synthase